jgi:hypothetical protein
MRTLACALCLSLCCALPVKAAGVFAEVAPGFIKSNDFGTGFLIEARAGLRTDWFTPAIVAFGAPIDPGPISHFGQGGGVQAWGVLLEARVHNPGRHQFSVGAALGWGQLLAAQDTDGDLAGLRGEPAVVGHVVVGYRLQLESLSVGLDAALRRFNRTRFESDEGAGYQGGAWALGLTFALGFKFAEL